MLMFRSGLRVGNIQGVDSGLDFGDGGGGI